MTVGTHVRIPCRWAVREREASRSVNFTMGPSALPSVHRWCRIASSDRCDYIAAVPIPLLRSAPKRHVSWMEPSPQTQHHRRPPGDYDGKVGTFITTQAYLVLWRSRTTQLCVGGPQAPAVPQHTTCRSPHGRLTLMTSREAAGTGPRSLRAVIVHGPSSVVRAGGL